MHKNSENPFFNCFSNLRWINICHILVTEIEPSVQHAFR